MTEQGENGYKGPYWRSNGAIFIVVKSLTEAERGLASMLREQRAVDDKLDTFFAKYPDEDDRSQSEEAMQEFADICGRLWNIESNLSCSTRTAILMAVIDLESTVNRFCYFNLNETLTETIERLSALQKLEVIHAVLGLHTFKGTHYYRAARALYDWRDAFAHGKCTDMPSDTIKKNHLSSPNKYPGAGDEVQEMLRLLRDYLLICRYLPKISKHEYTAGFSVEYDEIEARLAKLQTFHFEDGELVDRRPIRNK